MSKYDLETIVNRAHTGNLKEYFTPDDLKHKGIESFNAAEMDFKTAPSVIEAVKEFAEEGLFGFTLMDQDYTDAVRYWMKEVRGIEIEQEWIEPTMGTIFSVATAIRMCVPEDENIIIQPPVYNRYRQAAERLGRGTVMNPLIRESDGSYHMDLDDLEKKMADPANRLLIICNPQNPTGTVWPVEVLTEVARLALKYDVIVFSDEIFADYTFEGHTVPMYCTVNGGYNNGISATSLGKTFSFTGVNHANLLIADPALKERFNRQKYSDHYGSLEPMARAALIGAYSPEGIEWKNEVQELIKENESEIRRFFKRYLPEVVISPLEGSYVLWIDWRGLGLDPDEFRRIVYEKAMFLLEDGTDFCIDTKGFTRMSIATPKRVVAGALARLLDVTEDIRKKCYE